MIKPDKIFIVGDVRFSEMSKDSFINHPKSSQDFLIKIQSLMIDFGVVKLDVSIDPFNYKHP